MRETIDFGIDLGTTRSVIAVAEDDGVRVIKNSDGWDCTPSAVWVPKEGVVHVGRRARARTLKDHEDIATEFKLGMGVSGTPRHFPRSGVSLTPEQLSAEVLKSLCQDAAHEYGRPPEAAVITVPASFTVNQTRATSSAAALAGLGEQCPLVQEPTAAAIAYGAQDAADSEHWMVFDLGGGTFDAAVVSKRDGELELIQHAGDPYLGGKLIDWAIVEGLLAPAVRQEHRLSDFVRGNPRWSANFANLKLEAEEAKIQLSRCDTFHIGVDLEDGRGGILPFDYTLRRGAVEDLALPFYTRAIGLCRRALAESSLRPDHIDRLLLVGGPTLAPGLRELLADPAAGLGIPVDHSQDPTTVVARGAALFAATMRLPRRPPKPGPGEFTVELHYEPRAVQTSGVPVSGKLVSSSTVDWTRYAVALSNPAGHPPFHGPRVPLTPDGTFCAEVDIDASAKSHFTLELTDASGTPQRLSPRTLTITPTPFLPPDAVLTGTLGFGMADGTFAPMIRKGTPLPARVTKTYRTTIPLRRTEQNAVIRIPLLEGERRQADRNTRVGMLEIRPQDVRIDLPSQSEVEVTFDIRATNREVVVTVDVPLVEAKFEAVVNRSELLPPDHGLLVDRFHDLESRLLTVRRRVESADCERARSMLRELTGQKALLHLRKEIDAAAVDVAAATASDRRIRDLQAVLDDIEEAMEIPGLRRELSAALGRCEELVERIEAGPAERRELQSLRHRSDTAGDDTDPTTVRRLAVRARDLEIDLLRRTDQWPYLVFHSLVDLRDAMTSRAQADSAIAEGMRAAAAQDRGALTRVNERLRRLLPPEYWEGNLIGGLQ
ncbi:Hsp70 family protein [Streptomyces desertarenae]|uniref:Hsp70 family protein n=1 Tax=Streptomyces desertarenae TaxID=2666184 RepID=A0ABW4PGF9_9ACTN